MLSKSGMTNSGNLVIFMGCPAGIPTMTQAENPKLSSWLLQPGKEKSLLLHRGASELTHLQLPIAKPLTLQAERGRKVSQLKNLPPARRASDIPSNIHFAALQGSSQCLLTQRLFIILLNLYYRSQECRSTEASELMTSTPQDILLRVLPGKEVPKSNIPNNYKQESFKL